MQSGDVRVGFLGFGEAGQAIATGWHGDGIAPAVLCAFDIKTDGPAAAAKRADYTACGVEDSGLAGLGDVDVIISVVTADQAEAAAASVVDVIGADTLFFDCNSCAPQTKQRSEQVIRAAGGRYVDVAVMAPVYPKQHRVPCLVSGPHMNAALGVMGALGMQAKAAEGPVGQASAIKLCRSIIVKGMEGILTEMSLTAERLGVGDAVFASLAASDPDVDWRGRAAYVLERMGTHGIRRGAEMEEAAVMVRALGLDGHMAGATARLQSQIGALGLELDETDYDASLQGIWAALKT